MRYQHNWNYEVIRVGGEGVGVRCQCQKKGRKEGNPTSVFVNT